MRFRSGLLIGFASGYYLGAKAGRARYEQLNRWITKARSSEAVQDATARASEVFDRGVEKVKDATSGNGDVPPLVTEVDPQVNAPY